MKKFLGEYGFTIIAAIVIITLVTFSSPIGNTIKKETSDLVDSFGTVSETKMDQLDNSLWEAGKSDLAIQILGHTKYLYDVGEANLTEADIVRIGDIDCYVLEISSDQTKAKLITKDIYDIRFDTGEHNSADVDGHVGTGSHADITYDYKYSTLRTWMDEFYRTQLGADSRILPITITYYIKDSYDSNLDTYATGTIADQYVFALDAKEAIQYSSKFGWNYTNQMSGRGYGFWTTAGFRNSTHSNAWNVRYYGRFFNDVVDGPRLGARPAFWLSLE